MTRIKKLGRFTRCKWCGNGSSLVFVGDDGLEYCQACHACTTDEDKMLEKK